MENTKLETTGQKHISTVADDIKKCKTPQEIRRRYNIKNDFTPEEEEEIRKENDWCEEC